MANAIARVMRIDNLGDGNLGMVLHSVYTGSDIGNVMDTELTIVLTGLEQPAALRTMISAAISNWPVSQGFPWTVPGANIIMPTFQKG